MKIGDRVKVAGYSGIAFYIKDIQDDNAQVVMIGDNRVHNTYLDNCTPIADNEYCQDCGQMGCQSNIIN